MVACLPVLVPRFGPALASRYPPSVPRVPGRRQLIAAAVLFSLVPLVAAAALQPIGGQGRSIIVGKIAVPVDTGIGLEATVTDGVVRLRWNASGEGSTRVFYRVARVKGTGDTICRSSGGAANCFYIGRPVMTTRGTTALDRPPGAGHWTYRIGVGANWLDDPHMGDVFEVSPPVTVTVTVR
jgi:hypothetical protein